MCYISCVCRGSNTPGLNKNKKIHNIEKKYKKKIKTPPTLFVKATVVKSGTGPTTTAAIADAAATTEQSKNPHK